MEAWLNKRTQEESDRDFPQKILYFFAIMAVFQKGKNRYISLLGHHASDVTSRVV